MTNQNSSHEIIRYLNHKDQPHRIDGPAIIFPNMDEEWWFDGKRHRLDGPAIIYKSIGTESWWFNGVLHRIGGPAKINNYNVFEYYNNGILHRTDGPAIDAPFYKKWYVNGLLHREDGAAVEAKDYKEYWYNGERIYECDSDNYWKVWINFKLLR
jgi:hypothetical protein